MWPSSAKSLDSHPNDTGAAEADVAVVGEVLGDLPLGRRHVDEVRRQVQHQRGLVGAAVDPHAELLGRRRAALIGRQPGVGEERHEAVVQAQLAVGHADEGAVAAVAVEEHEPLGGGHRDAPPEVVEHGEQRRRRQPHRPRRPGVLVGLRVGERRQQPGVDLVADRADRGLGDPLGDQQVGVERQVRPVLLDGPERLHDDAAGTAGSGRCRAPGGGRGGGRRARANATGRPRWADGQVEDG